MIAHHYRSIHYHSIVFGGLPSFDWWNSTGAIRLVPFVWCGFVWTASIGVQRRILNIPNRIIALMKANRADPFGNRQGEEKEPGIRSSCRPIELSNGLIRLIYRDSSMEVHLWGSYTSVQCEVHTRKFPETNPILHPYRFLLSASKCLPNLTPTKLLWPN